MHNEGGGLDVPDVVDRREFFPHVQHVPRLAPAVVDDLPPVQVCLAVEGAPVVDAGPRHGGLEACALGDGPGRHVSTVAAAADADAEVSAHHDIEILDIDNTAVRQSQIRRLEKMRSTRDEAKCQAALDALREGAKGDGNLLALAVDAARERAQAATGLPDPVVSLGINNFPIFDPSFDTFLPTNKAIGIRQQIPNWAGREPRSAEALRRAVQNDAATDMRFAELRAALQIALIEKRRIEAQRILAEERDAKYAELEEIVQTEIDSGRPVVFRLAEIDVERAEVARTLAELEGQLYNGLGVPSIEQQDEEEARNTNEGDRELWKDDRSIGKPRRVQRDSPI